jgi:transcriptional regulator with XRE-family HTH domain
MAALNLREARKAKKLNQKALSEKTGVYAHHIGWLERGLYSPNETTRKKLESALGPIDWLETSKMVLQSGTLFQAEKLFSKLMAIVTGMPEREKREFSETVRKYFNNSAIRHERIKRTVRSHAI